MIGDSGASLSPWAARSNEGSLFYALQLAGFLNCSSTNVSSAYDCLMATDAVKINQFALYGSPSPEVALHFYFSCQISLSLLYTMIECFSGSIRSSADRVDFSHIITEFS